MKTENIIPNKCNICDKEIFIPLSIILPGKSLICDKCHNIICPKCSITLNKKTYCINCKFN